MLCEKIDYASSKLTCNNELALLVRVAVVSPLPKNRQIFGGPEYSPGSYLLNSRTIISSKTIQHLPRKQKKSKKIHHSGHNSNNSPILNKAAKQLPYFCSFVFSLLFFLTLSISSLYLFYKTSLYCTIKKRYKLIRNTTRHEKMLCEKIDYAKYLTWFIENYPQSAKKTKDNQQNETFWKQFK